MEFKELIEARRSVRKYVASEISKAEVEEIVGEALNAPSWKNTEVTRSNEEPRLGFADPRHPRRREDQGDHVKEVRWFRYSPSTRGLVVNPNDVNVLILSSSHTAKRLEVGMEANAQRLDECRQETR